MNIIEKLGITPGPWEANWFTGDGKNYDMLIDRIGKGRHVSICKMNPMLNFGGHKEAKVISAAPDMIETLIEALDFAYRAADWYGDDPKVNKWKAVIEEATGKKWEELRKLL